MVVALHRAGQIVSKLDQRHQPLRSRFDAFQLDVPIGQLVADDHGEVGMFFGGRLQRSTQLARGKLATDGKPLRPEQRRHSQARDRVGRIRQRRWPAAAPRGPRPR